MKILKVPRQKYNDMCRRMRKNLQIVVTPGETLYMTEAERKEYWNKKLNPDISMYVDYWTGRGLVRIVPK